MNETQCGSHVMYQYNTKMLSIVALTVMFFISIIANGILCWRLITERCYISRSKQLFLHLAIADLMVTIFTIPSQVIWEYLDRRWDAHAFFCPIFKVLQTFALVSSGYIVVSVAVDRHQAIVSPLSPRRPRPAVLATIAWFMACLPSFPNFITFRVTASSTCSGFKCVSILNDDTRQYHRKLYLLFVSSTAFIIPIVIVVALYVHIIVFITLHNRNYRKEGAPTHSYIPEARRKTFLMTAVFVVVFLVTSLPHVILQLIIAFGDGQTLNNVFVALAGVINASNSSINPFIYFAFSRKRRLTKSTLASYKSFQSGRV